MATTARIFEHPDLDDVELTTVLFTLSDPARLDLIRQLAANGPAGRQRTITLRRDEIEARFPGLLAPLL